MDVRPPVITFYDETGINPLPAGIIASVYGGSQILPSTFVGKAYVFPGGTASVELQPAGSYTATFSGTQAPAANATFTADAQGTAIATVLSYRSPSLSTAGYALEQTNLWPTGPAWWGDAARSRGGNAYALAYGLGAVLQTLDLQIEGELGKMRLPTCAGADIDSWAYDFFGNYWTRCAADTDDSWRAEIEAIFQTRKCTIAGLTAIINVFWSCIVEGYQTQQLALDTQGGADTWGGMDVIPTSAQAASSTALGADTYGGMDNRGFLDAPSPTVQKPTVIVFDVQSNPTLSAAITPNITVGQFCVYLQYPNYTDSGIRPVNPLTPLLGYIVNLWKAAGVKPIYAVNTPP